MQYGHFENYFLGRWDLQIEKEIGDEIVEGLLTRGRKTLPIRGGIIRCSDQDYAEGFGLQWKKFRNLQIDSLIRTVPGILFSKTHLSFNRFWNDTGWRPKDLYGKTILEVGCGAGRFTEIMLDAGAEIVSIDLSDAIEINYETNKKNQVLFCQADILDLPFECNVFDFVFCFGVLQHTPDPSRTYSSMLEKLKPGGELAVDCYARIRWSSPDFPRYCTKYALRKLTANADPLKLMKVLEFTIPVFLPVLKYKKRVTAFLLSVVDLLFIRDILRILLKKRKAFNPKSTTDMAVLDWFDTLASRYDHPKTLEELRDLVTRDEVHLRKLSLAANGLVACVKKPVGDYVHK
jgi:2-polyprenyl-3-methyl-5-hydroxy-6-metoxy-1,4-benzoquinol methylase